MQPSDTDPTVHQVQIAAIRALSPERRAEVAAELARVSRGMAREGIRLRHPGYTEKEVSQALLHLLYGEEINRLTKKP